MEKPVTALVASEGALTTATVEAMLRSVPGFRVIPADLAAVPSLVDRHDPGVLVLAGPGPRIAALLDRLSERPRAPAVIVLTPDPHDIWTSRARRAGVRAVLRADASAGDLAVAVAASAAGLILLHPDALRAAPRARAAAREAPEMSLTQREHEILERMAEGLSNRTIARRLQISRYTVKFHVASILAKLGAGSRTEAVTLGVRHGLITL
jgi:DNA-binding NarL/FixJ family response regulator